MSHAFGLLALCLAGADGHDSRNQPAESGQRVASAGFHADVEVRAGGLPRHGRVIITPDGGVQFEHLDEGTRRWATEVIRRVYSTAPGWDSRSEPVHAAWGRLGPVQIETTSATIRISRHRPLAAR